jgi:outer membrane lipoprotein-sorting protein
MLEKERSYRFDLIKKLFFITKVFFIFHLSTSICLADIQKKIIDKLITTQTLTFNFKQKIADKEEIGICFIKYPLLMKCNYKNLKGKIIISNGKTVAIIKKKYKKIYLYPVKSTPLFFILKKEKIIEMVRKTEPTKIGIKLIEFIFIDKKKNEIKILFDKETFALNGWETKDAYSNDVSFKINDLMINNQIVDNFFKIPKEKDL